MARFSSLSQSQDQPQIHACRWSWCRLTFDTNLQLVQHVMHDHVDIAVPVRRKDIPIYRRVEEGVGESLSFSGLRMSAPSYQASGGSTHRSIEEEVAPASSLPSPPASSPTSLSAAAYEHEGQHPSSAVSPSRHPSHSLPPEPPFQSFPPPSHLDRAGSQDLTTLQRRQTPPTFASLSSPVDYTFEDMFVDPPTPSFDSLVASAIGTSQRQPEESQPKFSPPPQPSYESIQDSENSSTSSSSCNYVEKELTQSMEVDDDQEKRPEPYLVSRQPESHPTHVAALGVMANKPPVQAWYGTRSARTLALPLVDAGHSALRGRIDLQNAHSILSQSSNKKAHAELHPGHAFRSGTLQITSTVLPSDGGSVAHLSLSQDHSPTQSQSQSQESSLEYVSYPPLQTQAPYRSQSSSQ